MTGQQLKNSILQWAIQGKLVPQIASEGTAEDLLKEIRAEKEKLVKEGKLKKKDLELNAINDDDKLFDIPNSWSWVRIGDIFIHASGKQLAGGKDKGTPREYITTSNLYWNRFVLDTLKIMCFTDEEVKNSSATKGDLLVCEGGAGYGRSAIWPYDYDICLQNHVHRLRPLFDGASEYVYYIMYYLKESNQLDSVGTAMPGLSAGKLKMIPVPLPPLAEQKRIVSKIEELMPLVEEYGKAQERLNVLNKELPEKLKKSVLQEAIMGRLVPQDPKEGTADELLAEIRKEKEKLVKEGKLKKKDLEVKPIEEDEVPFEVPSSWKWVRIKDVCHKIVDGDHNPPTGIASKTDYMMLSSKNINFDKLVNLCSVRYLEKEMFDIENQRTQLTVGDVLFTSVGTLGRSCVFNDESLNLCFQRSVSVLSTLIYNQYLKRYLDSPFVQSFVADNATGTAQKGFYLNQLEKMVVPLPPLAEQKRIVEKVETILAKIDS